MSALGQKQTYAVQNVMSALPPIATAKADIGKLSCSLWANSGHQELASAKKKPRILHTECGVGVRRPSPMDLWGRNHGQDSVKPQNREPAIGIVLIRAEVGAVSAFYFAPFRDTVSSSMRRSYNAAASLAWPLSQAERVCASARDSAANLSDAKLGAAP